ncbi:MAG TPA: hypothetical protein VJB12_04630 [Candidatus Nanoarchaeia archaeon]|nr:hypothetical protein [Candidatus Nanoarchaeia archaeon]
MAKTNAFEIILLLVGISAAYLGFKFINLLFLADGALSWNMILAIFLWLIMLLLFILMSLQVNVAKNQLLEIQRIAKVVEEKLSIADRIFSDHEQERARKRK